MCWTTSTSAWTRPSTFGTSENQEKLRNRIEKYHVEPLNPPRDGKKLLVLDIDYTLFDHRSTAERPEELMRPYLHEFLASAYEHYDIAIWSATGMKWIEVKMRELGVLSNPNYRVMQLVDAGAMISVQMEKYGVFNCKPLGWLWGEVPRAVPRKEHDHVRRSQAKLRDEPGVRAEDSAVPKAHMNRDGRRARRPDRVPAKNRDLEDARRTSHHAQ